MEPMPNRYDTPVPIPNVEVKRVSLNELATAHAKTSEQSVLLAIDLKQEVHEGVIGSMPISPATRFIPYKPEYALVRGYYAIGRVVFLTGNARLRTLLSEPVSLDLVVDAIRRRRNPQTGMTPMEARFVGPLETCLMRREGRWTELTQRGEGPAVAGVDAQNDMAYAIQLRGSDRSLSIVRGRPTIESIIDWTLVTTAPDGLPVVDASRMVRDQDGALLTLVTLQGERVRLLTLTNNKVYWGEEIRLPGSAIQGNGVGAEPGSILTQRWAEDGYLVTQYSRFYNLPLLAYLKASG
jgi:hypothetical protein